MCWRSRDRPGSWHAFSGAADAPLTSAERRPQDGAMTRAITLGGAVLLAAFAAACGPTNEPAAPAAGAAATADEASDTANRSDAAPTGIASGEGAPFAAIRADETIRFTGAEPFWGGTVRGGELVYSTPENQGGETIPVRRFAGNNGLGFSGMRGGAPFDMTITPGACSDGMSDRSYPFTVTLKLGEEQRSGCAWTERTPFTGPANP